MARKGRGAPSWQHKQQARKLPTCAILSRDTGHVVIPGLPAEVDKAHETASIVRLQAALKPTPEALNETFSEIILLYNSVWLLMERYPQYKGTLIEEIAANLRVLLDRVKDDRKSFEDEDYRKELVRLVSDLTVVTGKVPAIKLARCEVQAQKWMKKNKGKK